MFQKLRHIFFITVFMVMFSFSSFAMIPYDSINDQQVFENGPWIGYNAKYVTVDSSGNISAYMGLPDWREGTGLGEGYYRIGSSGRTQDFYWISGSGWHNFTICSYDPLQELYLLNLDGSILGDVLEDAFLAESDGKYFYGVSVFGGVGVGLRTGNMTYITELHSAFNGGSYHDIVMNSIPYLSGVYDGNSSAVKYPGLLWYSEISTRMISFGYSYPVFPVVGLNSNPGTSMQFTFSDNGGVIHEGSRYTFNFKLYNVPSGNIFLRGGEYIPATVNGNSYTASIDGREGSISDIGIGFGMGAVGGPSAFAFAYKSSSSDDIGSIPPDDSGGGSGSPDYSSALTSIGSSIKDLAGKLSAGTTTIVNNITNQTTQITNTITNTVTNMTQQITQGLSDVRQGITDKLQGVEEGISGTIEDANKEQIENDQKLHDELIKAEQENTEKVESAIEEHGNFIIDGLKGLFIPSDEFFKAYFDDLYAYFSDRFGFLSFPIDLVIRIADLFLTSEKVDAVLTLPSFEISGYKVWEDYSFNFTEFLETSFPFLISAIQTVTSIGLIMAFVNLCQDKWNEVMRS